MIKLMIVDDEQIVREGIKFIIEKTFSSDLHIVSMAKSGREAIEAFDESRPQIVLMDIQMPGINGIEAIKAIKLINPTVKFVIISAYEQFDYAKSAVELGVNDYILKPINKIRLETILRALILDIENDREVKKKEIDTQEKLDKVLPVLEFGYIYSILMNNDYQKENCDYYSLLNIQKEYGYIMVIELGEGSTPNALINKIGSGVKSNVQYQNIRQAIKYKCKAIIGPLMVNRIVVLVYDDLAKNEYEQRVKSIELAESIQSSLIQLTDTEVYVGIGSSYKSHRLNVSYNEALKAISKMTGERVLHFKDVVLKISEEKDYNFHKIKSDQESIIRKMEEGNVDEVAEKIQSVFTKLARDYSDNIEIIQSCALELMVLTHTSGYRNGIYTLKSPALNYVDDIKALLTMYDLKNYCLLKAKDISLAIKQEKETKVSAIIGEAMSFIELNYDKDLRLKDVAEAVCISPQYFSKVFKEELGVNFIDYLTNVRINAAKGMLKEGTLTIKEICFMIGYNDPNYFSRLFKKVEGISPTEFE